MEFCRRDGRKVCSQLRFASGARSILAREGTVFMLLTLDLHKYAEILIGWTVFVLASSIMMCAESHEVIHDGTP